MTNDKKTDLMNALEGQTPKGAVPIWELEFHAWDAFSKKHLVLGTEFEALSSKEQEKALHTNTQILLSVAEALHFAGLTVPGGYWEIAPGVPAYYWLPPEARFEQIKILRAAAPSELMLLAVSGGVMAMPAAEEYVAFAYKLFDAPEEIVARAEDNLRGGLENAKRLRDVGIEAVITASDIADNHGPFFNPQQMERFILPYLRKWAEGVKQMGLYAILHSDGDLTRYLDAIADSGIHALQAVDPVAGMDIGATKAQVGDRLCLCGNLDCGLLITATPEAVYHATRDLLLLCKSNGGFVLGASNAVQPEVPPHNYRAIIQAWKDHGQYQ